jgi:hypothetical protein
MVIIGSINGKRGQGYCSICFYIVNPLDFIGAISNVKTKYLVGGLGCN